MQALLKPEYTSQTVISVTYQTSAAMHQSILANWKSSGRKVMEPCPEVSIVNCDVDIWWMLVKLVDGSHWLVYHGTIQQFEDGLDVMWVGEDEAGVAYVSTLPQELFNPDAEEQIGVVSENIELRHLEIDNSTHWKLSTLPPVAA